MDMRHIIEKTGKIQESAQGLLEDAKALRSIVKQALEKSPACADVDPFIM